MRVRHAARRRLGRRDIGKLDMDFAQTLFLESPILLGILAFILMSAALVRRDSGCRCDVSTIVCKLAGNQ